MFKQTRKYNNLPT
ncbi:hypothetical protein A2U01_0079403, partial [Trifolium medium]|nr:hypothetical protein [Trifolium medium]